MRVAGFVMLFFGLVALAFALFGLLAGDKSTGHNIPFFENSWMIIMAIFWTFSGLGVVLTFGKEDDKRVKR